VIIALSKEGRTLVDQFRQRRQEIFDEALAELSETERRQAVEVLEKVVRALETYEASASFRPDSNSMGKKQSISS
jgi:DNA-binding MarR family transcriptional regulator